MKIAVVFPGQGSQCVGMGYDFYKNFPVVTQFFNNANTVLGYDLLKIMFEGSEDELRLTQNTQPALLTMSAGVWELLKDRVKPSFFAGHSLGEYSAVYAAGGISFEDAVKAVHNRGKFMQQAVPVGMGAMAAILGLKDEVIVEECVKYSKPDAIVEPANFNTDGQVVIAGHTKAVAAMGEILKNKGAKRVVMLPVSAPFHCSLMESAKKAMADYLNKISVYDLEIPVYNNVDAVSEINGTSVKDALIRQVAGAVRWSESVRNMIAAGIDTFVEVGSGSVLSGLIKKIDKNVNCINISKVEDLDKLSSLS